jgi:pSer/pThr/pTyr-binding forkhead associated (FHA) protein
MMQLEVGGKSYPIGVGEMVLGAGPEATVPVHGTAVSPRHAIVQGWADGGAAVRACPGAEVMVNGVRLGSDPTPILHGDKLQVGDDELLVVDSRRIGRTQIMNAAALADATAVAPPVAPAPGATGGRLVCLTDGREYEIGAEPLVFGREAGADVVVPGDDVSRRHAEIRATDAGYVLMDFSSNGTFVNGARVDAARPLRRADIIRVGPDEFRFYSAADGLPLGAMQRLNDTMHGVPATPLPATPVLPAPIASLLGRSGVFKGTRFPLRAAVASVGRGEYNDVVLRDPSVSTMHAKLQRRDGVWIAVDLGSTNGTFIDDEPVKEELPLSPGAVLKFGEVALMFEPLDDEVPGSAAGTRAMRGIDAGVAPAPERLPPRPAARRYAARVETPRGSGWIAVVVGLIVVAAVVVFMLLK